MTRHRRLPLGVEPLEERAVPAQLPAGFTEATFTSGLTSPTSMAFAPDGRLFVTEKNGTLRVVETNGTLVPTPFLQLNVSSSPQDERGLLGVTFDPAFTTNRFLYVFYTANAAPPVNRVSRFTASAANPNVVEPGSESILLDDIPSQTGNHNGGSLHFGVDGKLYISVGDSAVSQPPLAQMTNTLAGKLLRLEANGAIPGDNPLVGQAGARGEIWALGFRNPFTFAVHPLNGTIFVNDVGQNTTEEINTLHKGGNYGWPTFEGGDNGNLNFIDPIHTYAHSGQSAAITGGVFSITNAYPSGFQGYFFSDYLRGFINILDPLTHEARGFATGAQGTVDLDVAPDGNLMYLSISAGRVVQVRYAGVAPTSAPSPSPSGATGAAVPTEVGLTPLRQGRKTRLFAQVRYSDGRVVQIVSPFQQNLFRAIRAVLTQATGLPGVDGVLFTATQLGNNRKVRRTLLL